MLYTYTLKDGRVQVLPGIDCKCKTCGNDIAVDLGGITNDFMPFGVYLGCKRCKKFLLVKDISIEDLYETLVDFGYAEVDDDGSE